VLDIWAGFADYPKAANADTSSDALADAALIQWAKPGNHRQSV
jgi:hypothetical protein